MVVTSEWRQGTVKITVLPDHEQSSQIYEYSTSACLNCLIKFLWTFTSIHELFTNLPQRKFKTPILQVMSASVHKIQCKGTNSPWCHKFSDIIRSVNFFYLPVGTKQHGQTLDIYSKVHWIWVFLYCTFVLVSSIKLFMNKKSLLAWTITTMDLATLIKKCWCSIWTLQHNIVFSAFQIISVSTATILQQDPYIWVKREYNNIWIIIINQFVICWREANSSTVNCMLVDGFQHQHSLMTTEYLTHSCDCVVDVK